MKALVTGAGGFVGANLARRLLLDGYDVVALARPGGDRWRLADVVDDVAVMETDVRDSDAVRSVATQARPDVIFHLAAHGAYSWQSDLDQMLRVNVGSTQALLDVAAKREIPMVNAGSSSEYGFQDHPPREDELPRPNSYYAVTKLAATQLCQLAADRHGVHVATLRLYSIYGPWEDPRRLMPTLVAAAQRGEWPPLVGPATARDFVWIGDACQSFIDAATVKLAEPGAIFNIASGTQTTLAELVDIAAGVFSVTHAPSWGSMEPRAWDTSVWVGDPEKAHRELGWQAVTPLRDGLMRFARHLESRGSPTQVAR